MQSLDYVVQRSTGSEVRSFGEEADILGNIPSFQLLPCTLLRLNITFTTNLTPLPYCAPTNIASFREHLLEHRERKRKGKTGLEPNLLQFMSSFDLFLVGDNYTKRNAAGGVNLPVAHVIVT